MQIIQEQQAQATRVIRVSLTTAGLILTLISISASSGIIDLQLVSRFGLLASSPYTWIVMIVGFAIFILFSITVIRIFSPAMAVLSPELTDSSIFRLFNWHPFFPTVEKRPLETIEDEYAYIFEESVSLRTGIDADKAGELIGSEDIENEIVDYHVGCIRGNEEIIEANRAHLSEIYRTASIVAFFMIVALMYSVIIPVALF